jgi:fatty acid desaturase
MHQPTGRRLPHIDYAGFSKEIFALRNDTVAKLGEDDIRHFKRVIRRNRLFTFFGYLTAWIFPNPISAYCISQGIFGRWLIMHHVGHGGYDQVPDMPERYTSKVFAQGWRRYFDWFDWIDTKAWNYEHNVLHHMNCSESNDPDLVEDHATFLRNSGLPRWAKYLFCVFISVTWKYLYYAPNTLRALEESGRNEPEANVWRLIFNNGLDFRLKRVRQLWFFCLIPYALVAFVIIPALFLPLGLWAVFSVLANRIIAECMTNFHAYLVIAPNHSGDDIYRFDYHFQGKEEFAVNQLISSCNYHTGTETIDYLQIWLNYQIEHHLYPRLPMIRYRELQPKVKALCDKYGVPYIQESVWRRFWKMIDITVGNTSHPWLHAAEQATSSEQEQAA